MRNFHYLDFSTYGLTDWLTDRRNAHVKQSTCEQLRGTTACQLVIYKYWQQSNNHFYAITQVQRWTFKVEGMKRLQTAQMLSQSSRRTE